jgi:hypothetical protein
LWERTATCREYTYDRQDGAAQEGEGGGGLGRSVDVCNALPPLRLMAPAKRYVWECGYGGGSVPLLPPQGWGGGCCLPQLAVPSGCTPACGASLKSPRVAAALPLRYRHPWPVAVWCAFIYVPRDAAESQFPPPPLYPGELRGCFFFGRLRLPSPTLPPSPAMALAPYLPPEHPVRVHCSRSGWVGASGVHGAGRVQHGAGHV